MTTLEQRIAHAGDQTIAAMSRTQGTLRIHAEVASGRIAEDLVANVNLLNGDRPMHEETGFDGVAALVQAINYRIIPTAKARLQTLAATASDILNRSLPELAEADQLAKAEALTKATIKGFTVRAEPSTSEEKQMVRRMKFEGKTAPEHVAAHCEKALKRIAGELPRLARATKTNGDFLNAAAAVVRKEVAQDLANRLIQTYAGFASDVIARNNAELKKVAP